MIQPQEHSGTFFHCLEGSLPSAVFRIICRGVARFNFTCLIASMEDIGSILDWEIDDSGFVVLPGGVSLLLPVGTVLLDTFPLASTGVAVNGGRCWDLFLSSSLVDGTWGGVLRGFDLQIREMVFGFVAALTFGILERFNCPGEWFAYFVDVTFANFFGCLPLFLLESVKIKNLLL